MSTIEIGLNQLSTKQLSRIINYNEPFLLDGNIAKYGML
jgi:hypothetical protein